MLVEFASVIDAVTCAMSRTDQLVGQIGIADYKQTSSTPKKRFQLSEVESLKTSLARHQSAASCLQ